MINMVGPGKRRYSLDSAKRCPACRTLSSCFEALGNQEVDPIERWSRNVWILTQALPAPIELFFTVIVEYTVHAKGAHSKWGNVKKKAPDELMGG